MISPSLDRYPASIYDRLAPSYDKLHRRWLRHAGGEAQAALEAAVRALATAETHLLDAGCGTGAFARTLIAEGMSPARITLLDSSDAMLARCSDTEARQVKARLEALPFEPGRFDIVTCAWALETVPCPEVALRELCRVVRHGGILCLTFCAEMPAHHLTEWVMRQAITWRGTGQFLSRGQVMDTLRRSRDFEVRAVPSNGPATTVLARRLCKIGAAQRQLDQFATKLLLISPRDILILKRNLQSAAVRYRASCS